MNKYNSIFILIPIYNEENHIALHLCFHTL